MTELQARLKLSFDKRDLVLEALTHESYVNEHKDAGLKSYERLEYLGDATLQLITAEHLFNEHQDREGKLTKLRASLINNHRLAKKARDLGLGGFLLLSKGEIEDHGKDKDSILASSLEALVGVIFLERRYEGARAFVERELLDEEEVKMILDRNEDEPPIGELQERCQKVDGSLPDYIVKEADSPDHTKRFRATVHVKGHRSGMGEGKSKREAMTRAAEDALSHYGEPAQ
jgi:ribonuclease-3